MEGSEHGAEAAEFGRNFCGVHGGGMESDVILRGGARGLERGEIGIFIGEENLQGGWGVFLQPAREVEPGTASAGTHINDVGAAGELQNGLQQRGDGSVGAEAIHRVLERVGDFVAEKFGEPGLFVEFDELYAAHGGLACEEYAATVAGAANRSVEMCGSCAAVALIHDGAGQVVGPVGGVVVGPDAGVDLGDDDLGVGGAEFVDFFCEQCGGVDAVGADFDFLGAVAGD